MIRFLYNLLFPVGLLLFLPGYVAKMRRRGNYRRNIGQRFGIYAAELRARLAQHPQTWIHAVSVGEVAIALKLATKLREREPLFHCALTTTTTTGYAFAETEAPQWMTVLYHPLDFWPVVRRAFRTIRPRRIVLIEAEVWPNLVAEAHTRRIPTALVNARLSARSEARFRRFRFIVARTFRCLDLVCVQERRDMARWESLGVQRDSIKEVGSIKYDPSEAATDIATAEQVLRAIGVAESRPVLLGGSTHRGEEEILARAFLQLRREMPEAFLIIAPRHVERAVEIVETLEQLGLRMVRRSQLNANATSAVDCLLLDTTGELRHWYGAASVVFIGKSLTANGGQNPVESILAGKPVVFGPHMENFATLAQSLVKHDGAVQIGTASALAPALLELLRSPQRRRELVKNAEEVLAPHRGATERTAQLLLALTATGAARR